MSDNNKGNKVFITGDSVESEKINPNVVVDELIKEDDNNIHIDSDGTEREAQEIKSSDVGKVEDIFEDL